MKTVEKILIPAMIILGFFFLIFVGIKVLAINKTLVTWSGYDSFTIDNQ